MKKLDILYFYLIIGVFIFILGFYLSEYLYDTSINVASFISNKVESYNPGIFFFFKNNIIFFLIVTILPFINLYHFAMQFFNLGISVNGIIQLPLNMQFEMLYRHLFFEIIALIIAIIISYEFWNLTRDLLKDKTRNWKKESIKIGILYLLIILCTFIGAVLEGSASVANQQFILWI